MKVFINNRNYVTWPKGMAEFLSRQGHEVIFLDNGSTYEPLLDFYSTCPYKVERLPNLGKTALWDSGIAATLTEPYVLTDPDYDLSMIPDDWPEVLLEGLAMFPVTKCGLSWDESKVPPENPAWILDQFNLYPDGCPYAWGSPLPNNFYNIGCDTSFAVYRPGLPFIIDGVRKGRPYTGIHLPWHVTLDPTVHEGKMSVPFDEEVYYYFKHVEHSSCTHVRVLEMIAEYERRQNEKGIS